MTLKEWSARKTIFIKKTNSNISYILTTNSKFGKKVSFEINVHRPTFETTMERFKSTMLANTTFLCLLNITYYFVFMELLFRMCWLLHYIWFFYIGISLVKDGCQLRTVILIEIIWCNIYIFNQNTLITKSIHIICVLS